MTSPAQFSNRVRVAELWPILAISVKLMLPFFASWVEANKLHDLDQNCVKTLGCELPWEQSKGFSHFPWGSWVQAFCWSIILHYIRWIRDGKEISRTTPIYSSFLALVGISTTVWIRFVFGALSDCWVKFGHCAQIVVFPFIKLAHFLVSAMSFASTFRTTPFQTSEGKPVVVYSSLSLFHRRVTQHGTAWNIAAIGIAVRSQLLAFNVSWIWMWPKDWNSI